MAIKTTVALEDDLDGGPADETLRFRLGTAEYEIDLNAGNADQFRADLAPFVEYARRAESAPRRRTPRPAAARRRSADVRAWAKEHGIQITDRGRIPGSVIKQYEAAVHEH
jgi:hypothetical protein